LSPSRCAHILFTCSAVPGIAVVPYFASFYNLTGYSSFLPLFGSYYFSYSQSYRPLMFSRVAGAGVSGTEVDILDAMKSVLRWNDFASDPLSRNRSSCAISARADLVPMWSWGLDVGVATGGIDAKCTSASAVRNGRMNTHMIAGSV
jgi:hypothetical protein